MRLRNIPNADSIIKESTYVIDENNIKDIIENKKTNLEIGIGKGDFIIESAIKYKDINFIGIEKYATVLVKVTEKLKTKKIDNLKIVNMDAENVDKLFEKSIDTLYLNFSDPWPKKRHSKRRLTSEVFLEKYEKIFKKDAHIIMKTDNRKLFEYSLMKFSEFNYIIKDICLDLYSEDTKDNIPTEYEMKFKKLGPIYKVEVYKNLHK